MTKSGYEYLIELFDLKVSGVTRPCSVDSKLTAASRQENSLSIPLSMVVQSTKPVDHVVFALKNQGVQLEILQAIMLRLDPSEIQTALNQSPNGRYLRQIAFLFEQFTEHTLHARVSATGYVNLFDEKEYVTGPARRNQKYKINMNGLGDFDFCPVVRRTKTLSNYIARDLFADLAEFVQKAGGEESIDRVLGWAYLSETRGSFELEREKPSEDKARRFVELLQHAHNAEDLTEDYLALLQNSVITNPLLQELSFRTRQNWLSRRALQSRISNVTFIPPEPVQVNLLMQGLLDYANAPYPQDSNEALIKSLLVAFGFVFNHPFFDGNGRISRFLIHHGLCRAGLLSKGLILPISVALKQHEGDYLTALESVSKPIRKLWRVHHLTFDEIDAEFEGSGEAYRYWDGTAIAEFGLAMAQFALDHTLIEEQSFLEKFDQAYQIINNDYDLIDKDLINLIRMAVTNEGVLSKNRRKQFTLTVPGHVMDAVELTVQNVFFGKRLE